MLIPKKDCEIDCENWTSRVWLALTVPRHVIPCANPSVSGEGFTISRTI